MRATSGQIEFLGERRRKEIVYMRERVFNPNRRDRA